MLSLYNPIMVIQIINLVLSVVVGIAAGACLLRCYMQWFGSQLGPEQRKLVGVYLFPLTNWIVIPLRRVIPSIGRLDSSSLLAAYLLVLVKVILLSFLITGAVSVSALLLAILDLVDLTLSGLIGLVFIHVFLSWLSAGSQTQYIISLLMRPLLGPIQRMIPKLGALDLSPLILLLVLQILQIMLNSLK
jgi:YggT family protein